MSETKKFRKLNDDRKISTSIVVDHEENDDLFTDENENGNENQNETKEEKRKRRNRERSALYRKNNPEKRLATRKRFYEKHKEQLKQKYIEYNINNKDKRNETLKRYYQNNQDECNKRSRLYSNLVTNIKSAMIRVNYDNKVCSGYSNYKCNCSNPILFENDHTNRNEKYKHKDKNKRGLMQVPLKFLHQELKKCTIKCIKCHRIKTKSEYKYDYQKPLVIFGNQIKLNTGKCSNTHCKETVQKGSENLFDWDHINPEEKTYSISHMIHRHFTKQSILDEIKKCRLLCCSCHRLHTAKRLNYPVLADYHPKIIEIAKKCLVYDKPKIILAEIVQELKYDMKDLFNIISEKIKLKDNVLNNKETKQNINNVDDKFELKDENEKGEINGKE